MSVKQRLKEYIIYKDISERSFCSIIGVSTGYVSAIKKSIQPDKVNTIALHFPDLNTGWLLTGEGGMIKKEYQQAVEVTALKEPNINPHFENRSIDSLSRALDRMTELYGKIVTENESLKEENEELKKAVSAQRGTA